MRHNLVVSYLFSLLILGTTLTISVLADGGTAEQAGYTPAFSQDINTSMILGLTGFPKAAMILIILIFFLVHGYFLHKILKEKRVASKQNFPLYWGILFAPYVVLMILTY